MRSLLLCLVLLTLCAPAFAETELLLPSANASVELTPSAGQNWQCVDEDTSTLDTADYVTYNYPGHGGQQQDLYEITNPTTVAADSLIDTVRLCWYGWRSATISGGAFVAPVVTENGTTTVGTEVALTTSGEWHAGDLWSVRPSDGQPWTLSDLQNLQAGILVIGTGLVGGPISIHAFYVEVTYRTGGSQVIIIRPA